MFDPSSRYAGLPVLSWPQADGRGIAYVGRRRPPASGEGDPPPALLRIRRGDRLDLIAASLLGDPTLFWRIADANTALDPFALTADPGRVICVPRNV